MQTLKNAGGALALVAAIVAPGLAGAASERPTAAEAARIEKVVTLPAGARRLDEYDRYYARSTVDGRPVILGVYQRTWIRDVAERRRKDDPIAWKMATPQRLGEVVLLKKNELPETADGGCSVIDLVYDVDKQQVVSIACHNAAWPEARAREAR